MSDHEFLPDDEQEQVGTDARFYIGVVDWGDETGEQIVIYFRERSLALNLSPAAARSMAHSLMICADRVQPALIELDAPDVTE